MHYSLFFFVLLFRENAHHWSFSETADNEKKSRVDANANIKKYGCCDYEISSFSLVHGEIYHFLRIL